MVMHARKPQRINDGYFEKHQAHPYQNNSKYNSSKGNYSERYNDRGLRESPNGNSFRSESPDPSSPRDRAYQNKLYMQKMREKERDRDYNSSRDKYSDCTRSPKDKRREDRSNHERMGAEERVLRVGDWSEHISSSGKKYYYNCKTEVSQWEKPREWIDRERRHNKEADPRYLARIAHDKHSSTARSSTTARDASGGSNVRSDSSSAAPQTAARDALKILPWNRSEVDDMDISPSSTPRSDPERRLAAVATVAAAANATPANSAPLVPSVAAASPVAMPAALLVPPAAAVANVIPVKPEQETPLTIELPPVGTGDGGPPTPTHSEHQDCNESRKLGSPVNSTAPAVSSSLLALRPTVAHLTPSPGSYYFREELTNHIKNWPVHPIEKQVTKLSEEMHSLTSIHCTRVSAELKTARAVVRKTEIQTTVQEQRILFLRQQIKALEELNTQHSFMGD